VQGFHGILQIDDRTRYNRLIAPDRTGSAIQLAHCWAHAHRKLIQITRTGRAPIAEQGIGAIRALCAIEADIRGNDPATRLAARRERSAPILAHIDDWRAYHRARASAKRPSAKRWPTHRDELGRVLTNGCDTGAENRAVIASLIKTCKMNGSDPHAWLAATLVAIVKVHNQSRTDNLLPLNPAVTVQPGQRLRPSASLLDSAA
jgi:hypothetical protein